MKIPREKKSTQKRLLRDSCLQGRGFQIHGHLVAKTPGMSDFDKTSLHMLDV